MVTYLIGVQHEPPTNPVTLLQVPKIKLQFLTIPQNMFSNNENYKLKLPNFAVLPGAELCEFEEDVWLVLPSTIMAGLKGLTQMLSSFSDHNWN